MSDVWSLTSTVPCRMVKDRQRAERCRVAGIEAFKDKQWAESYRCFDEGIQAERTNTNLHSNAAMASLKMGCYVQAIEHCDKVIKLHDFMLNKPEHPLVIKAWQRKAVAWAGLKHQKDAVAVGCAIHPLAHHKRLVLEFLAIGTCC